MNELELAKMLFFYEQTVGAFYIKDILDLFSYYAVIDNRGENGFECWLKEAELEEQWQNYRKVAGLDECYND